MERFLMGDLVRWRDDSHRKPLLLNGARQVGKTYLLEEFGRRCFETHVTVNFETTPEAAGYFSGSLEPRGIVRDLSALTGTSIEEGRTLLILDEIQECPRALTSLKYFCEQMPGLAVCAAGSLLGISLGRSEGSGYPVGKVTHKELHPLSFREFLDASGKRQLRELVDEGEPSAIGRFATMLTDLLRQYLIVGGMPEALAEYLRTGDFLKAREAQLGIVRGYERDIAKHLGGREAELAIASWRSIPRHLGQENQRFVFGNVAAGARGRDLLRGITWLVQAGIAHKVPRVTRPSLPLAGQPDGAAFKLFCLDVGLLGAMANLSPALLVEGDEAFDVYRGALTEQYVLEQLVGDLGLSPCYWAASDSTAENDFLVEKDARIYAIEVKGGVNVRSKSLAAMSRRYGWVVPVRLSLLGYADQGWMRNVPLYAMGRVGLWGGDGGRGRGTGRGEGADGDGGLTPVERSVLDALSREPRITYARLADELGFSQSGVMRAIQSLKARGLIMRIGSPRDGHWEMLAP